MYYKAVSSESIIAKVYRDFKPSGSDWVNDAFEWIAEAMATIGHGVGYIRTGIKHEVKEYRTKLKCSVDAIEQIEYNGKRLLPNDAVNTLGSDPRKYYGDWYTLNPNYIHTSFESGTITVYADVIPTDEKGFPLVPDAPLHRQAISWYLLMMMLGQGYKHPVFSYEDAEKRWISYYPQAQNEGTFPDIEESDKFRKHWTAIIPNFNKADVFFDDRANPHRETSYVLEPQDNMRTIIHTSESTDDIVGGGSL